MRILICLILLCTGVEAVEFSKLKSMFAATQDAPYDMQIKVLKGQAEDEKVLILLHGMGGDNSLGTILQSYGDIPNHLISFNFPDAGLLDFGSQSPSFGTIREILPVLYLMKKLVVDGGLDIVNLYGFSAGGGALVNTVAVLNGNNYDSELASMGISAQGKKSILEALKKGVLLLDAPLKSVQEIIATRGYDPILDLLNRQYQKNGFQPIEALKKWQGLGMNAIVYFEKPDEILSNRDDALYVERLKTANGQVQALEGNYGGHISYHTILWKSYLAKQRSDRR